MSLEKNCREAERWLKTAEGDLESLSFAIPLEMNLEEQLKRKVDIQYSILHP